MTFEALIEAYRLHLLGLRRALGTVKNFRQTAADFARHCQQQGVLTPNGVHLDHFLSWIASMKAREFTAMSAYSRQRQVRSWMAWAALRGHLLMNPLRRFVPPKHPEMLGRGSPSEDQVRAMLEAPPADQLTGQRDRSIFEFLYGTGLRCAECVGVELDHLDLQNCSLRVVHAKGGRPREIPFGPHLQRVLSHYLAEIRPQFAPKGVALWVNIHGLPATNMALEQWVRKWRRKLQLTNFSTHSFRHAYATHMLHRGAPLVALQRLLGHQTLQMTARYTQLVPTDVQEEILRTHPRGKRKPRGRPPKGGR